MFEVLLVLTALVIVVATIVSYESSRDVLHPMLLIGPLFLYGTVVDPWLVRGSLERFFPREEDVLFVLALNLFAVGALVAGALHKPAGVRKVARIRSPLVNASESALLLRLALGLGLWALATYLYGISNAGGFVAAYSRAKGGGFTSSGYFSESMNLGLVTAVMASLAQYRRGWTLGSAGVLVLGLLPNLLQGTFGGRRGPLFLSLATLILGWVITRRRMPRLWAFWPGIAAAAVAVVFVASQRQFVHLGSEDSVQWDQFTQTLVQEGADEGSNFIYGAGFVTTVRHAGEYTWGRELAVNLLVRPVPRQVWPTKYEDVGATWVTSQYPGLGHVTRGDWLAAVGWLPLQGSSAISISDVFGEFGWGTVAVFYLIGRGFAELYRRRRTRGGLWQLLYLEALILSIYLATQSFSAFYHRFLILAVPTILVWRFVVEPRRARRLTPRRVRYQGPVPPVVTPLRRGARP